MSSDSLPMQTQDDHAPLTEAILTARGSSKGSSCFIKCRAIACRLRLVENLGMALLEKGDTGPSRADRLPDPPYFAINE
jgi:hypothetical protein